MTIIQLVCNFITKINQKSLMRYLQCRPSSFLLCQWDGFTTLKVSSLTTISLSNCSKNCTIHNYFLKKVVNYDNATTISPCIRKGYGAILFMIGKPVFSTQMHRIYVASQHRIRSICLCKIELQIKYTVINSITLYVHTVIIKIPIRWWKQKIVCRITRILYQNPRVMHYSHPAQQTYVNIISK